MNHRRRRSGRRKLFCPSWLSVEWSRFTGWGKKYIFISRLPLFGPAIMEEVTRLVSTGDCVKLWDAVTMAPLEQFNPHISSSPVAQACWSSNNQYLVSASSSGDKLVVSSLKQAPVPVVELAEGKKQTRVALSSSFQFLVSGGLDHCVHIWDLKTSRLHRSLKDHKEEVTCVTFNASDSRIISGSTSGELVIHSLTTNLSSQAFGHGSEHPIHDLRLSTVKRSLLGTVSDSGAVVLWDSNTQKELHAFYGAHKAPASGVAFSPTNDLLVVSVGLDKKIVCYDTASRIVLRSIRVESPLTSVEFTPDGTGLVVGSTQGKIYQYDLRSSSAPVRITVAHRTSVTCLRFQSSSGRSKSSKLGSTKISSKRASSSVSSSSQPDADPSRGPAPLRQATSTGEAAGMEAPCPEAGQKSVEPPAGAEKFSGVGRNSLDMFSPLREVASLEKLPGEGGGPQLTGRGSLDVFSPVREDPLSSSQRRTPLGTQTPSGGRYYSPLSVFQSPLPIKEEEPISSAGAEAPRKVSSGSSPSLEAEGAGTLATSQQTNHSQPAAPFFTPEAGLQRANGIQTQLSSDSPVYRSPPSAAGSGPVPTSLSQSIAEVVGQGGAAPLSSLQIQLIQNMIHETVEECRDACHKDIINLQIEMIRQFYILLVEIQGLMEKYSVNESLVQEIERLQEENRRLRTNY
ncbi:protein NEDD1 isoform X2 [Oryzias latipes]|uniref:protein NEDD1 isoform X2 n=1 Tax=Oryzias latipes TaxID=8090 RepID=UPI000CE215F3|nr:protein NEDD1 isoform X2 [Oryzias latipes]